jgi:hypothetical protein
LVKARTSLRWLVHRLPTSCRRYSGFAGAIDAAADRN